MRSLEGFIEEDAITRPAQAISKLDIFNRCARESRFVEAANFFENRSTEYSKASTTGTWEDAFATNVFATAQPEGPILVGE